MDLSLPDISAVDKIITCTVEGILEPGDLRALMVERGEIVGQSVEGAGPSTLPEVEDPTNLKRIRERHHSVARQIAAGTHQRLVAAICGYTESYLSILLNNPAMRELVDFYRLQHSHSAQLIGEKLRTVGMKALERLDEKLDALQIDDVNELANVAKLGLDRAGHGPSSTQHNVTEHHVIDHATIQALNQKARESSKELIIPIREVRQAVLAPPAEVRGEDGQDD